MNVINSMSRIFISKKNFNQLMKLSISLMFVIHLRQLMTTYTTIVDGIIMERVK